MRYLRLKKTADFSKLFKRGKRIYSPALTFIYVPAKSARMGIAINKKFGKAVKRNKIKRLLRAAFAAIFPDIAGSFDIVLFPKIAENYSYKDFINSLKTCVKILNGREGKNVPQ